MNVHASPLITEFPDDASLGVILDVLEAHGDKLLVLAYRDGQQVRAGYHATEVKAGSFVTLDCGDNPDAWWEVVVGRASVIDGDTIEIHGERIRFNGIDAPENAQLARRTTETVTVAAPGRRTLC